MSGHSTLIDHCHPLMSSPHYNATTSSGFEDDPQGRANLQTVGLEQLPPVWWDDMRRTLEAETGMDLTGPRNGRLRDALASVIRRTALDLQTLLSGPESHTRFVESVVAELTIGESFFLRNEHHMRALHQIVLPEILTANHAQQEVRLWSAGCAAGEEPYSLAILLDQLMGQPQTWQVSILGTDLNPQFLERGREGLYRQWSFRQTQIHKDTRFFTSEQDGYRVQEHLRRQVRFGYLNLVKDIYPSVLNGTLGLDLILFRNVAIYLKPEVTSIILQRLYRALRPGGWLLLGEIEVTLAEVQGFETHRFPHATFHRKPLDATSAFVAVPPLPIRTVTEFAIPPLAPSTMWCPGGIVPILPEWVPLPVLSAPSASSSPPVSSYPGDRKLPSTPLSADSATVHVVSIDVHRQRILEEANAGRRAAERFRMVHVMLETGQTAQAREELEICLQENPLHIEAYLLQAGLAEDLGQLREAERAYRRALYLDRECALAHFHLGLVLQQLGETAGSIRSLKTARVLSSRRDPRDLVEHGDGVCYGRLHEMVLVLTGEPDV